MNKKWMILLLITSMLLAGCTSETQYEVATYQGELAEGQTKSDYNKELFYRNDKKTEGPDPTILDNTERDGYYYVYGTKESFYCYRSKDLMEWECVGQALDNLDYEDENVISEVRRATYDKLWAPEVLYDDETELYYMFFSAMPELDKTAGPTITGKEFYQLMVAVSDRPDGGFQLVDFTDADSCGTENVRKLDTQKYPQYYVKYLLLNPTNVWNLLKDGKDYTGYEGYTPQIDCFPFTDDNGDKYLFWCDMHGVNRMYVVKMKNWLTPDWSTARAMLYPNFYTEEDYHKSLAGETVENVSYEIEEKACNEGPHLIKHNGKYYLTFSVNYYQDDSYQVIQAVADNPMGPYRKLTEEEGGIVVSGSTSGSMEVSGTGHHSMVSVGDKLYIVYHKHDDPVEGGGNRHHAIDEIKWITIKDKDGNNLEVMYTNGPTCSVQPKIEAYSEYKNIALEAEVSVLDNKKVDDISSLTDDLLSIYKTGNTEFMKYITETVITETTTFKLDFESASEIRAIMVYNSKNHKTSFQNISDVKLVCEEDGKDVIRYIDKIPFSSEYLQTNSYDGSIYYITPGAAAYAEFDKLNVKSIEITVEVPEGQETVGISEIRILGK